MDVFSKVQEVFCAVFKITPEQVSMDSTTANLKDWDSLRHMELIMALQKGLGVKFKMTEMVTLTSVRTIVEVTQKKLESM